MVVSASGNRELDLGLLLGVAEVKVVITGLFTKL